MYSTQKNTTSAAPILNESAIVGRYLSYPDQSGNRIAQGGLRTQGIYKQSLPNLPLVTIITVCLNSSKTMEQCIQSVLMQTYTNIEYIVIDGISTDGTVDLIGKYENAIDYYLSESDRGLYHAMNKGLELASGNYILILNSDDWYAPDCVEALVQARKYAGTSFVSALAQYVDQAGAPVQVMRSMPYDASLRLRMPLRHETMLLSAELYNDIGLYDEAYRIIADFHLTMRTFDKGYTHYEVPRALLFFRNTGVSSTDKTKLFAEREKLIKNRFPFLEATEVKLFGELGKLTPDALEMLAQKHRQQTGFIKTLKCYFEDQNRRADAVRWKNHVMDWHAITKTQNQPLVSIILPIYNAQKTLAACIDSVLSQTLKDFELICINDVTPDNSQAIVDDYRARDPRLISLINQVNMGLGASRNRGIQTAKGAYIFHIDPDDSIPSQALEVLVAHAIKHGSDMVKGSYLREQLIFGEKPQKSERKGLNQGSAPIVNTSLAKMPDLLKTTEGHWSYLYSSDLARRVPYPIDLKMGQDSIFLVSALVRAEKVSIISDVVYRYHANPDSAMNTFTFRKYKDGLEWRRRAWHMLKDAGMRTIGDRLLQAYWGEAFFRNLASGVEHSQLIEFFHDFRQAFAEAGVTDLSCKPPGFLVELFPLILKGKDDEALAMMQGKPVTKNANIAAADKPKKPKPPVEIEPLPENSIKVATFCSMDHGGAGTGTQRRVEALRRNGVDARILSLVVKSNHPYVERLVPKLPGVDSSQQTEIWKKVRERAILPAKEIPGFCATELFSLTDSVLDFSQISKRFDEFDVIHLHWIVGMFDFNRAGQYLANKPVVWTLADMNAFTGGCHYSEGCEGYKKECKACPLLGGKSNLAHEAWKIKKAAYQQLKNLHIICPSKWMAERVAQSSLLGDKHIHYIPNAFPTDRLKLTNKIVSRIRLGLPVNKKLLLFGADSLQNYRKGSDLLKKSLDILMRTKQKHPVEIVVFGNNSIKLPMPVHSLGYISDDDKLALAYSAADAFLFPSREDNAPLTVGESLLCGTPVVAFPVGHVPDIVQHGITGYIAEYLDADDFAKGIEWALNIEQKASILRSMTCRQSGSLFHGPLTAVERHVTVYSAAMHGNN